MVLAKTISKKNQLMSVATKIGIQLNAKLGGEIWGVTIPVTKNFYTKNNLFL
jgi:aubergine-like protein